MYIWFFSRNFIIDQSRSTFQLKYCAKLPPTFWVNQCTFYNYRIVTYHWQKPWMNQRKGGQWPYNYIISWSISTKVSYSTGIKLGTPGSAIRRASGCKHVNVNVHLIVGLGFCKAHIGTYQFLAHLSRRLQGELIVYQWLRRPASVVRPLSVNIVKHLLLYNHCANWTQISNKDFLGWGNKVCSNGSGHMTKMAVTSIYSKNPLKIFYSRTRRLKTLGLGM